MTKMRAVKGSVMLSVRSEATIAKSSSSSGGGARDFLMESKVLEAGRRWYWGIVDMIWWWVVVSMTSTATK